MKLLARIRSLWSGARAGSRLDAETDDEFRLHTELRARDLEREGWAPEEAIRRARQEFGNPARLKEEVRASRGLRSFDALRFSWLDFKLGLRMLRRYPGLTIVGTLAISVGIALGTIYFEGVNKLRNPQVPFPEGERVVTVRLWDRSALVEEARALHDFARWREDARTLRHVGAAIPFHRSLTKADGAVEPVSGAEISASAFSLARVPPVLGRVLMERDEQPAEPLVVVLSHALWQTRFEGDPGVVGRTVRLGDESATIVGVMPEGFAFPVNERIWTPLRLSPATVAPRSGPGVQIFARLAPGATMEAAAAELEGIGQRMAADNPGTHKDLYPRVTSYAKPLLESGEGLMINKMLWIANGVFLLLLAIMCANVATLVFARTATRGWEITVRNALGASRGRIVTQLIVEALVLTMVAAAVGLLLARLTLGYGLTMISGGNALPFWIDGSLSPSTVVYAAALALGGAVIIGLLPALRVTKGSLNEAMRNEGAARAGLRFGGLWTSVIIVQVAVTVALLPLAAGGTFESNRFQSRAEAIGAERFLIADLGFDRQEYGLDPASVAARMRASYEELERRILAEPGVEGVTFADRLPVQDQFKYQIEVDTMAGAPADGLRTSTGVNVGPGYFGTFDAEVIAGRPFTPGDYDRGGVLIVNQSFARHVFAERNVVGQRVRVTGGHGPALPSEEWYEIVGVVKDFGWAIEAPHEQAAMYYPRLATGESLVGLAVRVSDPEAFAPRLRSLAAEVSPALVLDDVQSLTDAGGAEARMNWALTSVAWFVSLVVLLLSATGIHSLMAFTVARRTREIGIRAALGASRGKIVAGIFSRAFLQIGLGALAGAGLSMLVVGVADSAGEIAVLLGAMGVMMVAGLTACAVPLRRALRIDPTEALRAET